MTIESLRQRIAPPDEAAAAEAARRMDGKTKPLGSLGRIETLAAWLAAVHGSVEFSTTPRAVVVMAADHGVAARGVSAYPRDVTAQMVANFARGGAAINVLARQMDVRTVIVDMGVAGRNDWPSNVHRRALAAGTEDLAERPAMSDEAVRAAIATGADVAAGLAHDGCRLVATGEMGIGNTTSAAALTAVFTGRPASAVTGRGTGLGDEALARKVAVVEAALALHRPSPADPLHALACLGGFEIAGLVGLILGAAASRLPVVLDGFIAGAAALVAVAIAPASRGYLVAGHRSAERGHRAALKTLGLEPILDLDLRLGEGTGAVLAMAVLDAAARLLREMASFESAGVSTRSPGA